MKSSGGSDSSLSQTAAGVGADSAAEMARFGAAKERKHSMEAGIALFNRCAVLHHFEAVCNHNSARLQPSS